MLWISNLRLKNLHLVIKYFTKWCNIRNKQSGIQKCLVQFEPPHIAEASAASVQMGNAYDHFSPSLGVPYLHHDYISASPVHSLDKRTSTKLYARLQSFSLHEQTAEKATKSLLEASWGTARLPTIVIHHCQLVTAYA